MRANCYLSQLSRPQTRALSRRGDGDCPRGRQGCPTRKIAISCGWTIQFVQYARVEWPSFGLSPGEPDHQIRTYKCPECRLVEVSHSCFVDCQSCDSP